jgi:multicomponent Na+:H+ antiporter subunit E
MEVIDHEGHPIHLGIRALTYFPWLFKEIAVSNLDVARAILGRDMPIEPRVFNVRASQTDELGRVSYANSITLTPGTVTVGLEDDLLTVHALTTKSREGLLTGEMDRRVSAMMGEPPKTAI